MNRLTGPQMSALVSEIIDATKEGRVTDWVERIAEIVKMTSMPLSNISWNRSPNDVAFGAVDEANKRGIAQELQVALASYKAAKTS